MLPAAREVRKPSGKDFVHPSHVRVVFQVGLTHLALVVQKTAGSRDAVRYVRGVSGTEIRVVKGDLELYTVRARNTGENALSPARLPVTSQVGGVWQQNGEHNPACRGGGHFVLVLSEVRFAELFLGRFVQTLTVVNQEIRVPAGVHLLAVRDQSNLFNNVQSRDILVGAPGQHWEVNLQIHRVEGPQAFG